VAKRKTSTVEETDFGRSLVEQWMRRLRKAIDRDHFDLFRVAYTNFPSERDTRCA